MNRDLQNTSVGELFFDDGISLKKLHGREYEYYQFKLVNKTMTITAENLPPNAKESMAPRLYYIQIGNAEDLQDTDVACAMQNGEIVLLGTPTYDATMKVLALNADVAEGLSFMTIDKIMFGTKKDQIC